MRGWVGTQLNDQDGTVVVGTGGCHHHQVGEGCWRKLGFGVVGARLCEINEIRRLPESG